MRVVSTYGRDRELCDVTKSITPILIQNNIISRFQYIKKTSSSLKGLLSNSKVIALRNKHGESTPCNRNCKNCNLMSNRDYIRNSNGKRILTAPGNCLSRNTIYAGTCTICWLNYVGRSTQQTVSRNNGHRAKYIKYCKQRARGVTMNVSDLDDEYTLGIHLHDTHNITDPKAFDNHFIFTILENCNPRDLPVKEHLWIHKMRSLYPHGLNLNSPFGLPLL